MHHNSQRDHQANVSDDAYHRGIIYAVVMVGSLIIALWARWIDPVINPDGVKYVLVAKDFIVGDYQAGLAAYKWPFYSITIALISKISQLPAEYSAVVFNAVMRGVGGIAFIRLSKMLGANKNQLWLAALVYLFAPGLNEAQSMIVRDFAYLACFLWMTVFYFRYSVHSNYRDLCLFIAMGLLAAAYRVEGLVYLLAILGFSFVFGKQSIKRRTIGIIATVIILPLLIYGAIYWLSDGDLQNAWQVLQRLILRSETELRVFIESLEPGFLQTLLDKLFIPVLVITPIAKLAINLFEVLSLGYGLILIGALFFRPWLGEKIITDPSVASDPDYSVREGYTRELRSWTTIAVINLLVLVFFALIKLIYTDRYPLSLALLIMLFVPFAISSIYRSLKKSTRQRRTSVLIVIGIVVLINSIEGLDRISRKYHLQAAGLWISEQSGGKYNKSRIYSNDRIVDYYAGQGVVKHDDHYSYRTSTAVVFSGKWKRLHFMAINISRHSKPGFYRNFRFRIGKEPDKVFENRKGDKVLVYDFRSKERRQKDKERNG